MPFIQTLKRVRTVQRRSAWAYHDIMRASNGMNTAASGQPRHPGKARNVLGGQIKSNRTVRKAVANEVRKRRANKEYLRGL